MANSNNTLLNPPNIKEYSYTPARVEDLKMEQGVVGLRFPPGQSTLTSAPVAPGKNTGNAVQPLPYLVLVWFGKKHFITLPLFERDGHLYDQYHLSEANNLVDSLVLQRQIYREWADPYIWIEHLFAKSSATTADVIVTVGCAIARDIVAKSSATTADVINWFKDVKTAPKPDPKEFDILLERAYKVRDRIPREKLTAQRVAEDGIELALIREDLKRLLTATAKFRENAIAGAESAQLVLTSVESASFQILNVVPTVLMMDPFRESVYKITMALVNAGARGTGGALASGTMDGFVQEAWSKLKNDLPGLIADIVLTPILPFINKQGWQSPTKEAVKLVVQIVVEGVANIWGITLQAHKDKPTKDEYYTALVQALATIMGKCIERLFPVAKGTTSTKIAIASCAESVAKVLMTDFYQAMRIADERGSDLSTVLIAESPSTIMKIMESILVGFVQRKGQQYVDVMHHERVPDNRNFREAAELGQGISVSQVWNTKPARSTFSKARSSRSKVERFTKILYDDGNWGRTNVEYRTAAQLRRYADEAQMWCCYRAPSATRLNHTADPAKKGAKWGKPLTIHAKSSNHPGLPPDIGGLVMKPSNGGKRPPTHKDHNSAQKQWDKSLGEIKQNGHMIRQDGVVFHPDQLLAWGKMTKSEVETYNKAVDVLVEMQKRGIYDFTPDADDDQLQRRAKFHYDKQISPKEWERIESALNSALIGFYSDLDPVDFVCAKTGKSVHFGNTKNEGMDLAAENRRLTNEYVSEGLDEEMIDQKPRDSVAPGIGGMGKPTRNEHPESEVQHGASMQMLGRAINLRTDADDVVLLENGCFAVGPGGKLVVFNHRLDDATLKSMSEQERLHAIHEDILSQWEALLQQEIKGVKVKDHETRMNEITKEYEPVSIKILQTRRKPPKLTVKDVEKVNAIQSPAELVDIDGLGYEISPQTVELGMFKRQLQVTPWRVRDTIRNEWGEGFGPARGDVEAMFEEFRKNNCLLGIDHSGSAVVIACSHYRQSMAEALMQLVKCRRLLGNIPSIVNQRQLCVWYELHTAYNHVNTMFIANRIGQRETGVNASKQSAMFGDQCSSFKNHQDKTHFAFCARGRTAAFTPDDLLRKRQNYFGSRLVDMWEFNKTRELEWKWTQIRDAGPNGADFCNVAIFTSPIWTNADVDRRYIEYEELPARPGRY